MQRSDLWRWAILPMGFLVGYRFMEHGVAKVLRGPEVFAGILQQLGLPLPQVAAWLTISTEILGGLAVQLGALVSWASIPLAAVKLLSISASGANLGPVGYEVDVVYLTALVMLILQGPGPLAISRSRHWWSTATRGRRLGMFPRC